MHFRNLKHGFELRKPRSSQVANQVHSRVQWVNRVFVNPCKIGFVNRSLESRRIHSNTLARKLVSGLFLWAYGDSFVCVGGSASSEVQLDAGGQSCGGHDQPGQSRVAKGKRFLRRPPAPQSMTMRCHCKERGPCLEATVASPIVSLVLKE